MNQDEIIQDWLNRLSPQERENLLGRVQAWGGSGLPGVDLEASSQPWPVPPIVEQVAQSYCDRVAVELLVEVDFPPAW
jgi:hypothetical protein